MNVAYTLQTSALIVLLSTATHGFSVQKQGQNPQKPIHDVDVDFVVPSARTLVELAREVNAVLRVRVTDLSTKLEALGDHSTGFVVTTYEANVLEEYKKHPFGVPPSLTLRFSQQGGQVETPEKVVRVRGSNLLKKGEYVVFLRWNEHLQEWQLAWGPSAAFELTEVGIKAAGDLLIRTSVEAMNKQTFLAQLSALTK